MSENNPEEIRTCLECGNPITGRKDQQFCTDACRTAFHNDRRKTRSSYSRAKLTESETNYSRKIYEALLNNRAIIAFQLDYHMNEQIALRDLLGKGFNLKYFTSEYNDPDLGIFRFCFDYGYQVTGENVYLLFRPDEVT